MSVYRNMRIRNKILTGFIVVILMAAAAIIIGITSLQGVIGDYDYIENYHSRHLVQLESMKTEFMAMRYRVANYIMNSGDAEFIQSTAVVQYNTAKTTFTNYLDEYEAINRQDDRISEDVKTQNSQEVNDIRTTLSEYDSVAAQILELALQGDAKAADDMLKAAIPVTDRLTAAITALSNSTTELSDSVKTSVKDDSDFSMVFILIIGAALVAIAIILAFIIGNYISKFITRLVDVAVNVSKGKFDINIDTSSKDEVGALAKSFTEVIANVRGLADEINRTARDFKDGDLSDLKVHISDDLGEFTNIAKGINETVEELLDNCMYSIEFVSAIAEGNFNTGVKEFPGDRAVMTEAFITAKNNLLAFSNDIENVIKGASAGNLDSSIESGKYKADWNKMAGAVNAMLAAVIAPIREASEVLQYLSQGEFSHKMDGDYRGEFKVIKDSINNTVTNISTYIEEIARVLTAMAKNDLNQEVKRDYVGRFSEIKEALNLIFSTFNKVIGDMDMSAEQVSTGAKHISETSMTLAQGATEQASSVEELTATVDSVNEQTNQNAQNAQQATRLSEELKSMAVEGDNQMKSMLKSMEDIAEASGSISKIIDIIKDISFQTNLLALNASIEAAHAGVHGSGFSVVAEEVRSLAAKSQKAANDTTDLIERSIQRVNEGRDIAVRTNLALGKIVDSVTNVSSLITEISEASDVQALSISQINEGVRQIAQVVQDNSATSEESAAAAEELSSQSMVMHNLVSVFSLKK